MKTKLGISAGFIGALAFLLACIGSYTPLVIVVGYVFICEKNEWLKSTVMKAAAFAVLNIVIGALCGIVPSFTSAISSLFKLWNGSFGVAGNINAIFYFVDYIFDVVYTAATLLLALMAFGMKTVAIAPIDNFVAKHSSQDAANNQ